MLWTVRHHCPSGARFALKFYRHETLLVIHWTATVFIFIRSREEVTQGKPLLEVLYGLYLLPLYESMQEEEPEVLKLWYKDDAAMMSPRERNARLLHMLM